MADAQASSQHKVTPLDKFFRLPAPVKFGILGGVNALIIAGLFFALINPKREQVVALQESLETKTLELNKNREIAADIPRFIREKEELEEKLKLALEKLPNEKELENLIDSISEAGNESGLDVKRFKPGKESPKGFYAEFPISMSVTGSYESFFLFCRNIGSLSRIVNLGAIKLSEDARAGVKADFTVTTFMFLPDKAAAAANAKTNKKGKK